MAHSQLDEPINTSQLEMYARFEVGLLDVAPQEEAARLSRIVATEPLQDSRKSVLKMFKEFFTTPHTSHARNKPTRRARLIGASRRA